MVGAVSAAGPSGNRDPVFEGAGPQPSASGPARLPCVRQRRRDTEDPEEEEAEEAGSTRETERVRNTTYHLVDGTGEEDLQAMNAGESPPALCGTPNEEPRVLVQP